MKQQIVSVIGSGIGGLASAIRLAAKGHRVTVFEQASVPGGKISELRQDGFRFDTGPSLFTMPWLVDELFALCGKDSREYLSYAPTRSTCKYFWEDATVINAWNDTEEFIREAASVTGEPPQAIRGALEKSRELYDITGDAFLFHSFHKLSNYRKKSFIRAFLNLHRLDALTSMHGRNRKRFRSPHLVQLFDRYATYNGSSPYQTPATMNIIAHLEHNTGVFFPGKGMYSIVESLVTLAREQGVAFAFNSPVQEVVLEQNRVKGIRVNGSFHASDMVVSNVDVVNFYRQLMPGHKIPSDQLKQQRSSSAMIFYWGVNREFPELELHNILFSDHYREEFDHLFRTHTLCEDPTVYLFISSKTVAGDAPAGMENWYVMINAPENTGQDWKSLRANARKDIIRKINRMLHTDIEKHIITESYADPTTIEAVTGSWRGSLYGLSSNGMFAAFNRHPNFRNKYQNLYFVGGSVHPGGGIPLCLASARIIDQEIKPASL